MDQYINIIKPQIISLIREKRYNTAFLELEDLGNNVMKIYYNNKFLRYLNLSKYKVDDFKRPYSNKWNKFRDLIMSDIVKSYTRSKDINVVCLLPIWRNHNILHKCISCLKKQTEKPDIILVI